MLSFRECEGVPALARAAARTAHAVLVHVVERLVAAHLGGGRHPAIRGLAIGGPVTVSRCHTHSFTRTDTGA
jgi:hypothetical protein